MVKCKVKGKEYELRLDLDALETLNTGRKLWRRYAKW